MSKESQNADGGQENEGGDEGQATDTSTANEPKTITLTEKQLSARLAGNKRGLQRELEQLKKENEQLAALKEQVGELIGSGLIDANDDLSNFRDSAETVLENLKSDREKAEAAAKAQELELKAARALAESNLEKFTSSRIDQEILNHVSPVAQTAELGDLLKLRLKAAAKADPETGEVTFKMNVPTGEDGQTSEQLVNGATAIELLRQVEGLKGAFKPVETGGAGTGVGNEQGSGNRMDWSQIAKDPSAYLKMHQEDFDAARRKVDANI